MSSQAEAGQTRLLDYEFSDVVNFRDLGGFKTRDGKITKYNVVFRSARLDEANKADVDKLIDWGIRTIIDMRDPIETTEVAKEIDARFATIAVNHHASTFFGRDSFERSLLEPEYEAGALRRYRVGLLGASFKLAHASRAPDKFELLKAFVNDKRKGRTDAVKMIAEEVMNPLGIIGQYMDMIDYCQGQILTVLKLVALPSNQAVLFHCSHGKDRTGIIAALLLKCAGVSDEDVITDYALSVAGLERRADLTRDELMVQKGLKEEFVGADQKTMRDLLRHIRTTHGSVDAYLEKIGFNQGWRNRLLANFVAEVQSE